MSLALLNILLGLTLFPVSKGLSAAYGVIGLGLWLGLVIFSVFRVLKPVDDGHSPKKTETVSKKTETVDKVVIKTGSNNSQSQIDNNKIVLQDTTSTSMTPQRQYNSPPQRPNNSPPQQSNNSPQQYNSPPQRPNSPSQQRPPQQQQNQQSDYQQGQRPNSPSQQRPQPQTPQRQNRPNLPPKP